MPYALGLRYRVLQEHLRYDSSINTMHHSSLFDHTLRYRIHRHTENVALHDDVEGLIDGADADEVCLLVFRSHVLQRKLRSLLSKPPDNSPAVKTPFEHRPKHAEFHKY